MDRAKLLTVISLSALLCAFGVARAFESSSASFEIHAGDVESVTGSSTSAGFQLTNAASQTATGASTSGSFQDFSGILYWMYNNYVPQYEQIHSRWRNDDGTEVSATWAQVEDGTYTSFPKTTIKRLRFEVSNSGWTRGTAPQFRLQYAQTSTCSSGTYADVPATATTEHWEMADSLNLTDASATTNVASGLTDANNTFVAGQVKDTGNTTAAITLASNNFTEIEYSVRATGNAVANATYCLRLLDSNLTPTRMLYTRYAKAVIVGYAASGTVVSSTYDTGTVYGAGYNTLMWQGSLNGGKVRLKFASSNCANGDTNAPTCNNGVGWQYYGSGCTTGANDWYDPGAANTPLAIGCASTHNNKRYFRYEAQLCSLTDCATGGSATPQVDEVDVNWSP